VSFFHKKFTQFFSSDPITTKLSNFWEATPHPIKPLLKMTPTIVLMNPCRPCTTTTWVRACLTQ